MSLEPADAMAQNDSGTLSPRTARFAKSKAAAAALSATRGLSPSSGGSTDPVNGADPPGNTGLATDGPMAIPNDDEGERFFQDNTRRPALPRPVRDLSALVGPATKDLKLPAAAIARIQRFAKAPDDERIFMLFVHLEVLLARSKEAAEDWEVPNALKALCRPRIVACFLSPHIPEYRRTLVKHITSLIPVPSKHLLPDATATTHKDVFKAWVDDYATAVRNTIKSVIKSSVTRYDNEGKKKVVDCTQGWCIGRVCDSIISKLGTDADVLVTTEIQSRVALLRWVYTSHQTKADGAQYWIMVDDTLVRQRELDATAMACDIAAGLREDLKQFTVNNDEAYTLVDTKNVPQDSLQALADAAMRDYYRTVKLVPAKRKAPDN